MSSGNFIVFSGGEGSGKTTVLRMLEKEFPHLVVTREPGGTILGRKLRELLLDDRSVDPDGLTELYLFMADRAEHMAKVVGPALAAGKTVVSDRHWQDTFAYQWYAKMGQDDRRRFGEFMDHSWPQPIWVWFDVDPEVGLQRRRSDGEVNRLDEHDLPFHRRVRDGFRLLFDEEFYGIHIDANQPLDQVYAEVKAALGYRIL